MSSAFFTTYTGLLAFSRGTARVCGEHTRFLCFRRRLFFWPGSLCVRGGVPLSLTLQEIV